MILKKWSSVLISILILLAVIFVSYIIIIFGEDTHEKAKILNSTPFKEHKTNIKEQFPNITKIDTYYQFGRITFDLKGEDITLEQCYEVVRKTKNFVKSLSKNDLVYTQSTIRVTFKFDDNFYEFESPYWKRSSDEELELPSKESNYDIWYKTINGEDSGEINLDISTIKTPMKFCVHWGFW